MMFVLSTLVQIIGLAAAAYVAFTQAVFSGIRLAAVVIGMHWAFSQLANILMLAHQKTLSEDELRQIAGYGIPGLAVEPPMWRTIATVCGCLYLCAASAAIWLFLAP
jgi:hypothetical protein